ncbi:hypothetical protein NHX12_018887 [Muraenolepis orangiensis]|uniref:Uncharacterized protein n=1 Tax=Muraenolepis orangiensis TaxID=630683 RepID=A0A9Q0EY18_9TELE|nr:hypothetical protein NHX12_018887 [Muraenolepis orangiensis]
MDESGREKRHERACDPCLAPGRDLPQAGGCLHGRLPGQQDRSWVSLRDSPEGLEVWMEVQLEENSSPEPGRGRPVQCKLLVPPTSTGTRRGGGRHTKGDQSQSLSHSAGQSNSSVCSRKGSAAIEMDRKERLVSLYNRTIFEKQNILRDYSSIDHAWVKH